MKVYYYDNCKIVFYPLCEVNECEIYTRSGLFIATIETRQMNKRAADYAYRYAMRWKLIPTI
jgi:hypothetical protein